MKAMVITGYGDTEVFKLQDMPKPSCKGKELLVRVLATSANPVDCKIRKGMISTGINPPQILGFDVSGIVEAIGEKVTDFKVGDEVYYLPQIMNSQGAYAEYHLASEEIVAHKPKNLDFTCAASIPLIGSTAWDSLIHRAKITLGETILIHAGAGGVGSFAIQLAKLCGAFVFTTTRSSNFDLVKELGADVVIDYKKDDFVEIIKKETGGHGVDVVFDTVGSETLFKSIDATKPFGRISSIVRVPSDLSKAYIKNISVHFVFVQSSRYKLEIIKKLLERKQLKPVIDSVLPVTQVASAHKKLEAGGVRGKIALEVV